VISIKPINKKEKEITLKIKYQGKTHEIIDLIIQDKRVKRVEIIKTLNSF